MKKEHRKKRNHSLLVAICITGVLFTGITLLLRESVYKDYTIDFKKQPLLTMMFKAAGDRVYPWEEIKENETLASNDVSDNTIDPNNQELDSADTSEDVGEVNQNSEPTPTITEPEIDDFEETDGSKKDENKEEEVSDVTPSEQPTNQDVMEPVDENVGHDDERLDTVEIGEVTTDYFDHALFIGDSRTVGLSEYTSLDNATYYADVGMSVYSIFDKKIAKVGKKNYTIEEALAIEKFDKIYIMLGINELGTGTTKTFAKKYLEVIQRIQELQPDAYIIIQSIMHVGRELKNQTDIFNNANISERNVGLSELADNESIFYIDVNEAVTDDEGYLEAGYASDGIHLKAKYYQLWSDYLQEHGLIVDEQKSDITDDSIDSSPHK